MQAAWSTLRDTAIEQFGSFPPATDELILIAAFERNADATRREFDYVKGKFAAGTIRAPWRIWSNNVTSQSGDVVVTTGPDRAKWVARCDAWVRSTGYLFPTSDEVVDELFGDVMGEPGEVRGKLRSFADDPVLKTHYRELWAGLQEKARLLEAAELERAEAWRTNPATDWRPPTHKGHLGTGVTRVEA